MGHAEGCSPGHRGLLCARGYARGRRTAHGLVYGIASDPVRDLSYGSLFATVDVSIVEPRWVLDVDQTSCSFEDCVGHTLRKTKICAPGVSQGSALRA